MFSSHPFFYFYVWKEVNKGLTFSLFRVCIFISSVFKTMVLGIFRIMHFLVQIFLVSFKFYFEGNVIFLYLSVVLCSTLSLSQLLLNLAPTNPWHDAQLSYLTTLTSGGTKLFRWQLVNFVLYIPPPNQSMRCLCVCVNRFKMVSE